MSLDSQYAKYRAAQQEAAEELEEGGQTPQRDVIRTARFELHVSGGRSDTVEREILDAFGPFLVRAEERMEINGYLHRVAIYTWDVEEPSLAGAVAKNISVTAAEVSEQDAYLVWFALTGFPMTYEAGKE